MSMTTMTNRADAPKGAASSERPAQANGAHAADKNAAAAAAATPAPAASGGIKALLPLIANLVLMPVLAYAMTAYVLVPKLAKRTGSSESSAAASSHSESHGSAAEPKTESAHGGAGDNNGKTKISVPLSKKTLVNVSGTMGTRYLLAEFVLVGSGASFKDAVEKNDAELRDAAASCLSVKSIGDLEKPGVRNLIRSELITIFNSILGKGAVTELYLTEFAIQ
jgi:flagellar FliL protein